MKRFIVSTVLALSALFGCASSQPEPPKFTPPKPEIIKLVHPPATLESKTFQAPGWHVTVPPGWKLVPHPAVDNPNLVIEYAMRSPEKIGKYFAAFTVSSLALDGTPADAFPQMVSLAMRDSNGVHVHVIKPFALGEHTATFNVATSDDGMVNVIIAVGNDESGRGYLVTCGGDVEQNDALRDACVPILKSFDLDSVNREAK